MGTLIETKRFDKKSAAHKQQTMRSLLTSDSDKYFFKLSLGVGSANTNVDFIVDTGSSVSWISRGLCEKREELRSICAQADNGEDSASELADGRVSGKFVTVTLYIGDSKAESVSHKILIADSGLQNFPDALLALRDNSASRPTFLNTLINNGLIRSKKFAIYKNNRSTLALTLVQITSAPEKVLDPQRLTF